MDNTINNDSNSPMCQSLNQESPKSISSSSKKIYTNKSKNSKNFKLYKPYIIIPLYIFFVINSGSIYWGFSGGFREIFYKMGAYEWENDERQETLIASLLTISNIANLVVDGISGNILDYLGPRYTLILGNFVRFIGWICLSFSSEGLQLYTLGMALIGASTGLIYFPFVSCASLFDKNRGLIVSLLGAAMSLSSIVPILIYQIWSSLLENMPAMNYFIICSIGWLVMMLLVAFLIVPIQSFETIKREKNVEEQNNSTELSNNYSVNFTPIDSFDSENTPLINKIIVWFKPLIRRSFLFIVPLGCLLVLRSEYLQSNTAVEIPSTYDLWIILSPLRFIPCIVMGEISDRFGHIKSMILMEVIAAIIFISNMTTSYAGDIIAAMGMFVFTSWIMTSQYVFISKTQPASEFGRLSGSISVISGAFLFFNLLIAPFTEDYTGRLIIGLCMIAISVIDIGLLVSTYFIDYKFIWMSK